MLKGSTVRGNLNRQLEEDINYSIKRYAKICKIAFNFNRVFPSVRVNIVPRGVDVYGGRRRVCNIPTKHVINSNKPIRLDAKVHHPYTLRSKYILHRGSASSEDMLRIKGMK